MGRGTNIKDIFGMNNLTIVSFYLYLESNEVFRPTQSSEMLNFLEV